MSLSRARSAAFITRFGCRDHHSSGLCGSFTLPSAAMTRRAALLQSKSRSAVQIRMRQPTNQDPPNRRVKPCPTFMLSGKSATFLIGTSSGYHIAKPLSASPFLHGSFPSFFGPLSQCLTTVLILIRPTFCKMPLTHLHNTNWRRLPSRSHLKRGPNLHLTSLPTSIYSRQSDHHSRSLGSISQQSPTPFWLRLAQTEWRKNISPSPIHRRLVEHLAGTPHGQVHHRAALTGTPLHLQDHPTLAHQEVGSILPAVCRHPQLRR